jgi:hypothetical protein
MVGYFGAPRAATAAMGAQEFALSSQSVNAMALQILDRPDFRKIPRKLRRFGEAINRTR